jgi:septum site-determining protein MinC
MSECTVTFKAGTNGLVIVLRQEDEITDIMQEIEKKLKSAGKFFKGASINIKYRGKKLSKDEEKAVKEMMAEKMQAEIGEFSLEDSKPETNEGVRHNRLFGRANPGRTFFTGINEGITKFHRGTVRSGQVLKYKGNIIVVGDVNPGATVEAAGNIIIMGCVRGTLHAGADGNRDAIAAALRFQPLQIKIADIITRSPDKKPEDSGQFPEIAFVRDNRIYVEKLTLQYK